MRAFRVPYNQLQLLDIDRAVVRVLPRLALVIVDGGEALANLLGGASVRPTVGREQVGALL